ncbi:MAG: hypothetical protein UW41_C0001G0012 [Candidatus Collierbacteria bacterium GW2011_GWC2_44_18]|uniref:Uncharacterized protein n=2 Tax=Microgenomates group TaxID=1794810 RepID=A0A0G1J8V8_9BACT|nr:MAG: hypothetical protein UW16_C0009G0038 [Microgenomates group bacterium GW2011_GWC1_44_10]KKT49866.1 MAG: hypothetical protein UW41_C0001G0012 [Candidatus Collierbacteria bacterium GW2011_GWC2_44_18]KKT67685.1 MAG: hypothetical protein UW60_C0002G0037 [Candidatus Woesebacteria bacterium GW2011_GWA2_44_33]
MNDEERLLEVPSDEDDNMGDHPGKRTKHRKTKEERSTDRKVVMWTLLFVMGMTLVFWLWPKIKNYKFDLPALRVGEPKVVIPKSEWKNYIEYKL